MKKSTTTLMLSATMMLATANLNAQHLTVQEHYVGQKTSARFQHLLPEQLQDHSRSQSSVNAMALRPDYIRHKIDDHTYDYRPKAEIRTAMRKAVAQAADAVQVSWEADYDPELFSPSSLAFINTETHQDYWVNEFGHEEEWGMDAFMQLPAGTYDVFAEFWGDNFSAMYYVIREMVEINADQHFVISPLEASQNIERHLLDENGTELDMSMYKLIDEEPWSELVEQGNLIDMAWHDLVLIDGSPVSSFFHSSNGWVQEWGGRNKLLHISPCSDRVMVGSCGIMDDWDYVTTQFLLFTNDTKNCTDLYMDPNNYSTVSDLFQRSPLGMQSETEASKGFATIAMWNGEEIGGIEGYILMPIDLNEPITMKVNIGSTDLGFNAMTHLALCDLQGTTHYVMEYEDEEGNILTDEWDDTWITRTWGLPQLVGENGIEYVNKGHDIWGNYSFQIPEDPDAPILEYPGHPVFSYTPEQVTDAYGNSCPITSLMMQNTANHPWYGIPTAYIDPCFIGRRGEVRFTDYQTLQATLRNNKQTISSDFAMMNEELFYYCMENGVDGLWDVTFVNTNIMVDDLEGMNTLKATFDGSKEDFTSPMLQMLDFRNQDNAIIDRFETADQGTLQFACGDFNLNYPTEGRAYFDCKPVTVKTEYSAYQEEAWTELTSISEKEEYFCRPAFGYFYSGSLAEVDTPSETGWYDLRITLTDEVGNTQEQVISPAFKIGEGTTTSIRSIEQSNDATIYTLQGQKAAKQLSAGFYIANGKKIVKM